MRKSVLVLLALTAIFANAAHSHGEDVPGPHGGYIRMPGAFHTEIVFDEKLGELKIYLLDINWQNPSTKDSQLEATLKSKNTSEKLNCKKNTDYYSCLLSKNLSLRTGALVIQASREGIKGSLASYELPLPVFKTKEDSHATHH